MITRKGTNSSQQTNEPRYNFERDWLVFISELSGNEQLQMFRAIADYGLFGREPENLTGAAADYFANVIRPNLDRQLKTGKRITANE